MKITPSSMKKYHVESIEITRETEYPPEPMDWSPYEAIVVDIVGRGLHLRFPVDIRLCNLACVPYSISPVHFALIEAMQGFGDYVEAMIA